MRAGAARVLYTIAAVFTATAFIVSDSTANGRTFNSDAAERQALASLRRAGGSIAELDNDTDGHGIAIDFGRPVSDNDLKPVRRLKRLVGLRLMGGGYTDRGLDNITGTPLLQTLVLINPKITDRGMEPISHIQSLVKLDINRCKLTAAGLSKIARLRRLERLYLYNAVLSDADLKPLESMKMLRYLDLPMVISDDAVMQLQAALPSTTVHVWRESRQERQ